MLMAIMVAVVQEQDWEAQMAERVRQAQQGMTRVEWMAGNWEGTGTWQGQEYPMQLRSEMVLDRTFLHSSARSTMGERVDESGAMLSLSADGRRYEGYYFMPGYASKFFAWVGEDGSWRWEETLETAGTMGRARGEVHKVSNDEYTEKVEFEMQPGRWQEAMTSHMLRVQPQPER